MKQSMLVVAMTHLDLDKVLALVRHELESGKDSLEIIEDVRSGMAQVGRLYEQGKYFLSDLMMSAEIFKDVIDLVAVQKSYQPAVTKPATILVGTVKNDIHDIGKNLLISLLRFNGFHVVDLGVDVPPQKFVEACREYNAKLIGLSGLLTASYDSMRLTVEALENYGLRSDVKVIIGGLVNEQVRQFVKADYWITDCSMGVELCSSLSDTTAHKVIS